MQLLVGLRISYQLALMKEFTRFGLSLPDRFLACVLLVTLLPLLLLVALVIQLMAGDPVVVADELLSRDRNAIYRRYRFRTTGRGGSSFRAIGRFLRAYSLDEYPGLWSVVRGDIGLRDFIRGMRATSFRR